MESNILSYEEWPSGDSLYDETINASLTLGGNTRDSSIKISVGRIPEENLNEFSRFEWILDHDETRT